MVSIIANWLLFLGLLVSPSANDELGEVEAFGENPGNLRMFVHLPERLKAFTPVPLVVALHGCTQNAESIAKQAGWNDLADRYGFAVVYPQQKRINNGSNCFNWFREEDLAKGSGETGSIESMVAYALAHYDIDTSRIFIYGVSAGAAMAVSLLANDPCTFQSGAILAGGPYKAAITMGQGLKAMRNPADKSPSEWAALLPDTQSCKPRLIVVHGTEDHTVDPQSSLELIDQWAGWHGLNLENRTSADHFAQNPLVTRYTYPSSAGESIVIYYVLSKTGHAIPVDPGTNEKQGGETALFAVDRDFFSSWCIAKDWGLVPQP